MTKQPKATTDKKPEDPFVKGFKKSRMKELWNEAFPRKIRAGTSKRGVTAMAKRRLK